jgi:hypothetical protein
VVSSVQILGFFSGDAGPALEAFGFLERIDRGWRVKGCARYLRITEVRREAGKRGRAAQLATAQKADVRANAGQTPGKTLQKAPFAQQLPSNCPANAGQTPGKTVKTGFLPGQKRALSPITEVPPKGGTIGDHSGEPVEGASASLPSGAGSGAHAAPTNGKRPRPVLVPGTPEYADAVARDDWNALGWKPA